MCCAHLGIAKWIIATGLHIEHNDFGRWIALRIISSSLFRMERHFSSAIFHWLSIIRITGDKLFSRRHLESVRTWSFYYNHQHAVPTFENDNWWERCHWCWSVAHTRHKLPNSIWCEVDNVNRGLCRQTLYLQYNIYVNNASNDDFVPEVIQLLQIEWKSVWIISRGRFD